MPDYDRDPLLDELETSTDAFAVSGEDAALQDELAAVMTAAGLPPHCGEPEVPYLHTLADGVYRAFSLADEWDHYEKYGADPAALLTCGTFSDAYAEAEAKVRDRASQLAVAGGLRPVPIRTLVQHQLAALLGTLVAVRERYRPAHPRSREGRIPLS